MPSIHDLLPEKYGYVVAVAAGHVAMNQWLMIRVGRARHRFDVKPPKMYTDNDEFNVVQRQHQNFIEQAPFVLTALMAGGLECPVASAVGGLLNLVGQLAFVWGYSANGTDGRRVGFLLRQIGTVVCFVTAVRFACSNLHCCGPKAICSAAKAR